ncbi:hypothetical protein ACFWBH_23975 [Streptomyces sp. NPDC059999]|nr:hypothetical protein [Streptomyces sp. NBC_01426]
MFVRILLWFVVLLRLVLLFFLRFVLRGWGLRVQLTNTAGAGVA